MTLARTTFDASCAAMMTQFLYARSGLVFRQLPKLCARELHKLVRRYARAVRTAVVRLGDECTRLSFERRGAVLCTDPPASVCTSVANCCYLRAGCCRTVRMGWCKTSGKVHTRLRFKLRGRSAPPCAQCCARMRIRCTRLSIPVATRMCTRCANFQTTAVSWLQRKSWHCGDARVMDVLLGLSGGSPEEESGPVAVQRVILGVSG